MKPPGPTRGQLLLRMGRLRAEPLEGLVAFWREHGDRFRIAAHRDYWVIAHPDDLRHVLKENRSAFDKRGSFDDLRLLIGDGLLTVDDERWADRRRVLGRAFTTRATREGEADMSAAVDALVSDWARALEGQDDVVREVSDDFARLTLRISSSALLGNDASAGAAELGELFARAQSGVIDRMTSIFKLPMSIPTPANHALRGAVSALDAFLLRIIRSLTPAATGFVGRLGALDETLAPDRIRDEAMTFLLAGYDTTSVALAWTAYLLATHPDVQERARGDEGILDGAISESLRLFPPVPIMLRDVVADAEVGGYSIRAGSVVACLPYLSHRHPEFWTHPEAVLPERWSVAGAHENPAYMPFGLSPRACIGERMARLWMGTTLRALLARFRLHPVPGMVVKPAAMITLGPRGGLRLRLSRA